ncbi:MAG: ethanolamine ammonia-lyase, partial [Planctomycetes bacterium]|nr:ethanolamine ammonia-lyase [Planctomycetota bacterium]
LLAAAGANYYMDVCLNTDRMLAYFDTSGHDDQTLREICGRNPAPEYREWALARGIFRKTEEGGLARGPQWGNLRSFCDSDPELRELLNATPAMYGFKHAGPRPANDVTRQVKANQAAAREAIYSELDLDKLRAIGPSRVLATEATSKDDHLNSPEKGSRLSTESARGLSPEQQDVQIVIADGLSADAVHHNVVQLIPVLMDGLRSRDLKIGRTILARYGRVKLAEHIADLLKPKLVVLLIGERPGGDALASRSLSAYLVHPTWEPDVQREAARFSSNPRIRFEYTVLSNIYSGGLPPLEAGSVVAEKALQILAFKAAGNRLEAAIKNKA